MNLPKLADVFFVHYQCEYFDNGEKITALCIYANGKNTIFQNDNEAESILNYANRINELRKNGLQLVHWAQDKSFFGVDHINKRYKDLTEMELKLHYDSSINLAYALIEKYGDKYVPHAPNGRLDNLANLNDFFGNRENELGKRTYTDNRILLITKIYLSAFNGTLKIQTPAIKEQAETENANPTFENNFDNVSTFEIYQHFKAGLVCKGYLTEQELNDYLKAAFELKKKPETLFKLKHTPTKQKIYTVFYVYYKDVSQKKHERQKEYAALLGDFFEGYKTEIIQTNWARGYKTKR